MSNEKYFTVSCDRCNEETTAYEEGIRHARAQAKEAKWRLGKKEDLCPKCAAQQDSAIADAISRVKAGNFS